MKKTLILALAFLLAIFCSTACDSDDDEPVATSISNIDELTAAFKNGGSYILANDEAIAISKQIELPDGKAVTLNLNGKSLKCSVGNAIKISGNLTLVGDGSISTTANWPLYVVCGKLVVNGEGIKIETETSTTEKRNAIRINGDSSKAGEVVFEAGSVRAKDFSIGCYEYSKLTVNGGTFESVDNAPIGTNGKTQYIKYDITINGGKFNGKISSSGYIACGIYMANTGTVTLNGGEFNIENGVGVCVRRGTLIANKFKVNFTSTTGGPTSGKVGDSEITIEKVCEGMEIVVAEDSGYPGDKPTVSTNNSGYVVKDKKGEAYTATTGTGSN